MASLFQHKGHPLSAAVHELAHEKHTPQVLYELCVQEADEKASEACKDPVAD